MNRGIGDRSEGGYPEQYGAWGGMEGRAAKPSNPPATCQEHSRVGLH